MKTPNCPGTRLIIWVSLFATTMALCPLAYGDEQDTRIQKRISELEAENRALRKVIAELKSDHRSAVGAASPDGLRIVVLPDDWGESGLADMRKVCESAAHPIASQLIDDGFAPIMVQRSKSGPISLFKRGDGNEYIVRLDSTNRAWAQLAYQFSHEFCHIVCNYRNVNNRQMWFEETLCELASIYSLRAMGQEWKTNAPYSNWKSYASALTNYARDRIQQHDTHSNSIAKFYRDNRAELEKTGTNRALNGYIAIKLLPIFESSPTGWQSLRYINLGPADENVSFKTYLTGWHRRVPEMHRAFVQRIASEFDLNIGDTSK